MYWSCSLQDTFSKIGVKYTVEGLTGNTFDSHRLVAFAGRQGADVQDKTVEAIFRLYFEEVGLPCQVKPPRTGAIMLSDPGITVH